MSRSRSHACVVVAAVLAGIVACAGVDALLRERQQVGLLLSLLRAEEVAVADLVLGLQLEVDRDHDAAAIATRSACCCSRGG